MQVRIDMNALSLFRSVYRTHTYIQFAHQFILLIYSENMKSFYPYNLLIDPSRTKAA